MDKPTDLLMTTSTAGLSPPFIPVYAGQTQGRSPAPKPCRRPHFLPITGPAQEERPGQAERRNSADSKGNKTSPSEASLLVSGQDCLPSASLST